MREWIAALGLIALAACDASISVDSDGAPAAAEGYVLEVRASDAEQLYLVTAPDGRAVAGRAAEGASMLIDGERARGLLGELPAPDGELRQVMSLETPGFGLSIRGDGDGVPGGADAARISINAGGRTVEIDALDSGAEGGDRAHVRITGADAEAARDFIVKADELSPDVQAQMLTALGLD